MPVPPGDTHLGKYGAAGGRFILLRPLECKWPFEQLDCLAAGVADLPAGQPKPQYEFTKVVEFDPQGSRQVHFHQQCPVLPGCDAAVPRDRASTLARRHGCGSAGQPVDQSRPDSCHSDQRDHRSGTHLQAMNPRLESGRQNAAGFSLIEVTLALGVAVFCLVTLFGLLPVGLTSNQDSLEQTMAGNIASAIVADLRCAQPMGTGTSPHFGFIIPALGLDGDHRQPPANPLYGREWQPHRRRGRPGARRHGNRAVSRVAGIRAAAERADRDCRAGVYHLAGARRHEPRPVAHQLHRLLRGGHDAGPKLKMRPARSNIAFTLVEMLVSSRCW